MRLLTGLLTGAAVIYGGYWFAGSTGLEKSAKTALADMTENGWQIDYSSLETIGFPSRFDTTVQDLNVVSPDGMVAWSAPFFQVLALSYRPNNVIAIWPETQSVTLAGEPINIQSTGLRASAHIGVATDLPLETATLESGDLSVSGAFGTATADRSLFAIRPSGEVASYDIWFDAENLKLPENIFSEVLASVVFDTTVGFDNEIRLRGATAGQVQEVAIRDIRLTLQDASIALSGEFDIDAAGYPAGRVTLSVTNYDHIIALGENAGLMAPEAAQTYQNMARSMAQQSDTLEVPLTLRGGTINMGPFPLGPAPRFR